MRFLAIADSDSYLKWSASFTTAIPDGWDFRQLVVESPVAVSDAQLAAAVGVSGIDPADVSRITAIELPAVKEAWLKQGAIPMPMTPTEFEAYLNKDIDKWAEVVKVSGATVR